MNLNKELKKLDKRFKKYLKEEYIANSVVTNFAVSFELDGKTTWYDIDFSFKVMKEEEHMGVTFGECVCTSTVSFFVTEKEIRDRHFMLGQLSVLLTNKEEERGRMLKDVTI